VETLHDTQFVFYIIYTSNCIKWFKLDILTTVTKVIMYTLSLKMVPFGILLKTSFTLNFKNFIAY
jgi:hypothetical protein